MYHVNLYYASSMDDNDGMIFFVLCLSWDQNYC